MGCRCADITELEADIKTLDDLKILVDELSGYDDTVQENLDNIAGVINDTVIVKSDDIHLKFKQLNNDSRSAIDGMRAQIGTLRGKLERDLKWARVEDSFWPHK